jgi:hypothetical protein
LAVARDHTHAGGAISRARTTKASIGKHGLLAPRGASRQARA